jgi:hypothetical protein
LVGGAVLTKYSELAREKMWARIHLIPALQAEEDRDQVRRYLADKAREKELLGTETKIYNSDRYVGCMQTWTHNRLTRWLQIRPTYLCHYTRARDEVNWEVCAGHVYISKGPIGKTPDSRQQYPVRSLQLKLFSFNFCPITYSRHGVFLLPDAVPIVANIRHDNILGLLTTCRLMIGFQTPVQDRLQFVRTPLTVDATFTPPPRRV